MQEGNTDAEGFRYTLSCEGSQAVVSLSGDLDMASASKLFDCLQRLVNSHVPTIVVDLSGLEFCDSSGLGVLLRVHQRAKEHRTRLVLRAPTPTVRRVFEVTKTDRLLDTGHG